MPAARKIFLKDLADIRLGYEDGGCAGALPRGKNAIQMTVSRAPTADTLATAKILDDYLVELARSLPPGIEMQKYDVSADALVARIMLLVRNGLGGLVIVVATLFIFLNARIAFWVAAGIPVAHAGDNWPDDDFRPDHQHDLAVCPDHDARHHCR